MPLIVSTLQNKLRILFDDPPQTTQECAQAWADAMQFYALPVVPPSATVAAAAQALKGALSGMQAPGAAVQVFTLAFASFGVTVAGGMPVGTGPAVPPAVPFILPVAPTSSPEVAATVISTAIDIWMRTGLGAPPASLPWS